MTDFTQGYWQAVINHNGEPVLRSVVCIPDSPLMQELDIATFEHDPDAVLCAKAPAMFRLLNDIRESLSAKGNDDPVLVAIVSRINDIIGKDKTHDNIPF